MTIRINLFIISISNFPIYIFVKSDALGAVCDDLVLHELLAFHGFLVQSHREFVLVVMEVEEKYDVVWGNDEVLEVEDYDALVRVEYPVILGYDEELSEEDCDDFLEQDALMAVDDTSLVHNDYGLR